MLASLRSDQHLNLEESDSDGGQQAPERKEMGAKGIPRETSGTFQESGGTPGPKLGAVSGVLSSLPWESSSKWMGPTLALLNRVR